MARGRNSGDWLLIQELLERGDPAFVEAIRAFHDAETLAGFAGTWYADRRAASRRLLLAYLDRPLNAYRHEPLVKRLFKLAEAAGDDEIMARFLVLFDRSIRRVRKTRHHYESREVGSQQEGDALARLWLARGFIRAGTSQTWRRRFYVYGAWAEEYLTVPHGTTMPRDVKTRRWRNPRTGERINAQREMPVRMGLSRMREGEPIPDAVRKRIEGLRLFSVPTRYYLRRRAWRYFRRLVRDHPERYVAAVSEALVRYEDADVADGLSLIDNWGLVHILFHHSPALVSKPNGWDLAEDHTLAELEPSPYAMALWDAAPQAFVDLLLRARCRPVRQWAILTLRRDPSARNRLSLEQLLGLLGHEDDEVVALAADWLREAPGVGSISPERWLSLIETARPLALERIAELMERHIAPDRLTWEQVVRLAASRPLPLARLGLVWLRSRTPRDEAECRALLRLSDAEALPLRPEMLRWVRGVLSDAPGFRPDWVLEWLDSRHADVRAEGLAWLREEPRG